MLLLGFGFFRIFWNAAGNRGGLADDDLAVRGAHQAGAVVAGSETQQVTAGGQVHKLLARKIGLHDTREGFRLERGLDGGGLGL